MSRRLATQKGSALLVSLLLIGLLSLLGIMAADNSNTEMTLAYNEVNHQSAFYVAEAGAQRAFIALNNLYTWRTGYNNQGFGDGSFSATLRDSLITPALNDTVIITARGEVKEALAEVELWTVPEYHYPFTYGLFAGAKITLDQNARTDSYASDSGTYAATVLNTEGSIGSNGAIVLGKNSDIGGDASTANGGTITIGVAAKVQGDTSTAEDSVELNIISDSEYVWAQTISNAPAGLSGSGYTYNAVTKALTTSNNANVILQTGVYYFSSIDLAQHANIVLAPGAKVMIYMDGDVTFGVNSTVNDGGLPTNLQMYSKNGSLKFYQQNSFYGMFYGPKSAIEWDQTTMVYGALVGSDVHIMQFGRFHYDRSLSRVRHGVTGRMLAVAWKQN
ncbi:MAG: hypothetical protein HY851_03470 [candidate division Zixibacteria bacterium]|nr:hypothetical protein [candidate division Zixibacteria bacterium]